jgi:hypothetical protein
VLVIDGLPKGSGRAPTKFQERTNGRARCAVDRSAIMAVGCGDTTAIREPAAVSSIDARVVP